jgi:membrane protein required for colicin V production
MTPILLDSIVVVVLLLSIVIAFFRGFIKEMLTIVNLGAAAAAAYLFGPMLLPSFRGWLGIEEGAEKKAADIFGVIPPEVMAHFLSYLCVFFGVFVILTLAGIAISGSVKALGLGPIDRMLGMAFGAARGFLLVFLIYLPFGFFMQPDQLPDWAKDSISVSLLDKSYRYADGYMKGEENGDTAAAEEPVDPNSIQGKLRGMADRALNKAGSSENATDPLTDEETARP